MIIFPAHAAVTPGGKLVAAPIPVAPVVVCVIEGKAVLIHTVWLLVVEVTVLLGFTIILPVALTEPQPPVKGML